MRYVLLIFVLCLVAVAADITGSWHLTVLQNGEAILHTRVEFSADGNKLTGSAFVGTVRELRFTGESRDGIVQFIAAYRNGGNAGIYDGRIEDGHMSVSTDGGMTSSFGLRDD